jgi:hypothetical protein
MARIPDIGALGARPIPRVQRSVARVRNAGAVADAVSGLGETITQIGGAVQEKEDRLSLAAARANLLKSDIAIRQELENEPDYETWETRYEERFGQARAAAAQSIASRSDRSLFEADTEVDLARGKASLSSVATGRRRDARLATLDEGLDTLADVSRSATDDAARETALTQASELIRGAIERGDITAEDGGNRSRRFVSNDATDRIETMLLADDYDGALASLERNRGRLDREAELSLTRRIDDGLDNRRTLSRAQEAVHGARPPVSAPESSLAVSGAPGEVADVLARQGWSDAVVAGFLGNFEVEGGYTGARGDGGTASGIAQWRGERRANFRRMFGKEPHDASTADQANFVLWEMANPEAAGMTTAQRNAILAAGTPEEAAALIDQYYERSSGAHRGRRQEAARGYHGGVSQAPQRHDLNDVYAGIDARADEEGWSPEETESVKAQAARIVARDETLLTRQFADAADDAARVIASLPGGLTNIGQIPRSVRERMDPTDVVELEQGIRERHEAAAEQAQEDAQARRAAELEYMRRFLPNEYARLDPLKEANGLAPDKYNDFLMDWTEARQGKPPKQAEIDEGIRNEVAFQERMGLELNDEEKVRLFTGMEAQLGLIRERKGAITAADYGEAYRSMTKQLPGTGGWLSRDRRVFEALEVPAAEAERIRRAWTGSSPPTDAQILQTWMELRR